MENVISKIFIGEQLDAYEKVKCLSFLKNKKPEEATNLDIFLVAFIHFLDFKNDSKETELFVSYFFKHFNDFKFENIEENYLKKLLLIFNENITKEQQNVLYNSNLGKILNNFEPENPVIKKFYNKNLIDEKKSYVQKFLQNINNEILVKLNNGEYKNIPIFIKIIEEHLNDDNDITYLLKNVNLKYEFFSPSSFFGGTNQPLPIYLMNINKLNEQHINLLIEKSDPNLFFIDVRSDGLFNSEKNLLNNYLNTHANKILVDKEHFIMLVDKTKLNDNSELKKIIKQNKIESILPIDYLEILNQRFSLKLKHKDNSENNSGIFSYFKTLLTKKNKSINIKPDLRLNQKNIISNIFDINFVINSNCTKEFKDSITIVNDNIIKLSNLTYNDIYKIKNDWNKFLNIVQVDLTLNVLNENDHIDIIKAFSLKIEDIFLDIKDKNNSNKKILLSSVKN